MENKYEKEAKDNLIISLFFTLISIIIAYFGQFAIFPLSVILFLLSLLSLGMAALYLFGFFASAYKLYLEKEKNKENNDN